MIAFLFPDVAVPGIENLLVNLSATSALVRFDRIEGLQSYKIIVQRNGSDTFHLVDWKQPKNQSNTVEEIIRYLLPSTKYEVIVEIMVKQASGSNLTATKSEIYQTMGTVFFFC